MTPDHQAVALYGHPFSSCTLKALTALNANDTPVAYRELGRDYPEHGAFVAAAHPAGRFPMLVDGDATVIEASAIIEHLALHYPGPAPLLPADPPRATRARMLDRVFDNHVMGSMQRMVNAHIAAAAAPGLPEVDGGKAGFESGWGACADQLKALCEQVVPATPVQS